MTIHSFKINLLYTCYPRNSSRIGMTTLKVQSILILPQGINMLGEKDKQKYSL